MSPHGVKLMIMCSLISSIRDLLFMNVVRESLFGFQAQVHLWCNPFVKGFLFCTPHSIRFCRGSNERG